MSYVGDRGDDIALGVEEARDLGQNILGAHEVLQDISKHDNVKTFVAKGSGKIQLLHVTDDHAFTELGRYLCGHLIILNSRNSATLANQRFCKVSRGGTNFEHFLIGAGEERELSLGLVLVAQVDLQMVSQ